MALQTSGAISMNDINVELGNSGTAQISLNDSAVRSLIGIASGAISLNDAYGATSSLIGSGPYAHGVRLTPEAQAQAHLLSAPDWGATTYGCQQFQQISYYTRYYKMTANEPIKPGLQYHANGHQSASSFKVNSLLVKTGFQQQGNNTANDPAFPLNGIFVGAKPTATTSLALKFAANVIDSSTSRPGYPQTNLPERIGGGGVEITQPKTQKAFEGAVTSKACWHDGNVWFPRNPSSPLYPTYEYVYHNSIVNGLNEFMFADIPGLNPAGENVRATRSYGAFNLLGNTGWKCMSAVDSPNGFGKTIGYGWDGTSTQKVNSFVALNDPVPPPGWAGIPNGEHIVHTHLDSRPTADNTNVGVNRALTGFAVDRFYYDTNPAIYVTTGHSGMMSPIPSGRNNENGKGYYNEYFNVPARAQNPDCASTHPQVNTAVPYAPYQFDQIPDGAKIMYHHFESPTPSMPQWTNRNYFINDALNQYNDFNNNPQWQGLSVGKAYHDSFSSWNATNWSVKQDSANHYQIAWDITNNFNFHFYGQAPNNSNNPFVLLETVWRQVPNSDAYGTNDGRLYVQRIEKNGNNEVKHWVKFIREGFGNGWNDYRNTNNPYPTGQLQLLHTIYCDPATGEVIVQNPAVDQSPVGVDAVLGGHSIYTSSSQFIAGVYTP